MTTFNRLDPTEASFPKQPSGYLSWGRTGKLQARTSIDRGLIWTEVYDHHDGDEQEVREFFDYVNYLWMTQTVFEITHPHRSTPKGIATGSPIVTTASQTGSSLNTSGWTFNITGILKAGDIIRIAGLHNVFHILTDANSDGTGLSTLTIFPDIIAGKSPGASAVITANNVTIRAVIADEPQFPMASAKQYMSDIYNGLIIKYREAN